MNDTLVRPFESIEDTQEFVALLENSIEEAIAEVRSELEIAQAEAQARRVEALSLALYKLGNLGVHIGKSRRILNDLRSIRRLLSSERDLRRGASV